MVRFQPIMRPGVDPASATNKPPLPPLGYSRRHELGLIIERDIAVPLRDGVTIYADL
jgi:predicted acyl esterase